MDFKNELLKAPNRKRKPECCAMRRPRIVKLTWDVDAKGTESLFTELGVQKLPESDDEDANKLKKIRIAPPTPVKSRSTTKCPSISTQIQTLRPRGIYFPQLSPTIQSHGSAVSTWQNLGCSSRTSTSDPWSKLSDEMVLNVFKWLPKHTMRRCLQVSRRWNRIGLDETLWRRVDLSGRTLEAGELGTVLQRGVAVLRLASTQIHTPIYPTINLVQQHSVSKLQFLDLSMSTASCAALEQIIGSCHILRKLSLENCTINNAVCRAIGQNRNLEVLNLNMSEGITESGLVPICNNLQKLDALSIGWAGLSKGALVYLVTCLASSVTKLNIAGYRDTLDTLEDDDIYQLCCSCPHLKELDVSDSTKLTGAAVEHVTRRLRGLEYIAMSRCYNVRPSYLPLLSDIATLLALDVFGVLLDSAVQQLREALPSIQVNKFPFSSIARPTTGARRTSIWGLRVRDCNV